MAGTVLGRELVGLSVGVRVHELVRGSADPWIPQNGPITSSKDQIVPQRPLYCHATLILKSPRKTHNVPHRSLHRRATFRTRSEIKVTTAKIRKVVFSHNSTAKCSTTVTSDFIAQFHFRR